MISLLVTNAVFEQYYFICICYRYVVLVPGISYLAAKYNAMRVVFKYPSRSQPKITYSILSPKSRNRIAHPVITGGSHTLVYRWATLHKIKMV